MDGRKGKEKAKGKISLTFSQIIVMDHVSEKEAECSGLLFLKFSNKLVVQCFSMSNNFISVIRMKWKEIFTSRIQRIHIHNSIIRIQNYANYLFDYSYICCYIYQFHESNTVFIQLEMDERIFQYRIKSLPP